MAGVLVLSPSSTSHDLAGLDVPRPNALVPDDSKEADAARLRFAKKNRLISLPSLHRRRSKRSIETRTEEPESSAQPDVATIDTLNVAEEVHDANPISLATASSPLDYDDTHDHYEWAVVYENQRGATLFSTPYYSSLSLLPTDPSPFTLPNASKKRSEQPPITLKTYPLPDGNWKWVSRCWMIDMRSNLGEVQHDGFEYNWMFRKHNWRADVGPFSAGGWVRRRRWIRLMVRPAKKQPERNENGSSGESSRQTTPASSSNRLAVHRQSMASSLPPSVLTGSTELSSASDRWKDMYPDEVWQGNEEDWHRLRHFMLHFGRDGRKLEVWRLWLGYYHPEHKDMFSQVDFKGNRREKQWTEDDGPLPSEVATLKVFSEETVAMPPREYLIPVLRKYGQKILRFFIYPDSRAQFLKLLALAGLLPEMNIPLGNTIDVMSEVDFFSYNSSLGKAAGASAYNLAEGIPHISPSLKPAVLENLKEHKEEN